MGEGDGDSVPQRGYCAQWLSHFWSTFDLGINPDILGELRQKRLNKFGEVLVIVIMSVACLKMSRNAIRKSFYE